MPGRARRVAIKRARRAARRLAAAQQVIPVNPNPPVNLNPDALYMPLDIHIPALDGRVYWTPVRMGQELHRPWRLAQAAEFLSNAGLEDIEDVGE